MNEIMRKLLVLPPQSSTVAKEIDYLHYSVISITMVGAISVTLIAIYLAWRYRASAQTMPLDPNRPRGISMRTEAGLIGMLLVLFVGWWLVGFTQFVRLQSPPSDSLPVYVTGKQWMWTFAYPDGSRSQEILYVPANRPVKLIMSSRDVIHSFYVPEFRIKQDVVPGRTTIVWFEAKRPGRYRLMCAEYCGEGHSIMRGTVVALAEEDYANTLREQPQVQPAGAEYVEGSPGREPRQALSLADMGRAVAARHGCFRCHTVDGTPHIGPTFARMYASRTPLRDGRTVFADGAYITESIMDPLAKIHAGFAPVMPSYLGLITAPEVGAIVEYIRSLRVVPTDTELAPLPRGRDLTVQPLLEAGPPETALPRGHEPPDQPQEIIP